MARREKYYTGGKRDDPDHRDFKRRYGAPHIPSTEKHPRVDLRKYVDYVYDQGKLNNCTANALCAAFKMELNRQAELMNQSHCNFHPSRLFVYYNARAYTSDTGRDFAVTIRETFRALYDDGVCQESLWPYYVDLFAAKPPTTCYINAVDNRICRYEQLDQEIDQIRACLKEGYPFVFIFELYDSFFDPLNEERGLMPLPSDEEIQNGNPGLHTVVGVGYNDDTQCITVLNSWGSSFGDNGYFYMPYKYIVNGDRTGCFWRIEQVCMKGFDPTSVKK